MGTSTTKIHDANSPIVLSFEQIESLSPEEALKCIRWMSSSRLFALLDRPITLNSELQFEILSSSADGKREYFDGITTKLAKRLRGVDNLIIGRRRIVVPKSAKDLLDWGTALDNCLAKGQYLNHTATGQSVIVGIVNESGAIEFAIEFKRCGTVLQAKGARNVDMPKGLRKPVVAALKGAGIDLKFTNPLHRGRVRRP